MLFVRILAAGIILSLVPVLASGSECPEPTVHERVRLSAVHDGDTLRLTDGRRLRLLSVNAPELAIDGKAEQPLARASREAVEAFFADTKSVHLSFESRRADRYGRLLAHVTHPSGRNLESYLVRQGLALPLVVPPDMAFATCLQALAEEARREGRGIWQTDYWQPLPATELERAEPEFRVVCGQISKVDLQQDLWLELTGDLVIRIAREDAPFFAGSEFGLAEVRSWVGRSIRVSGWLQDRSNDRQLIERGYKPWLVQARSPFALEWMEGPQSCR
jgi:micrococcal nuclease